IERPLFGEVIVYLDSAATAKAARRARGELRQFLTVFEPPGNPPSRAQGEQRSDVVDHVERAVCPSSCHVVSPPPLHAASAAASAHTIAARIERTPYFSRRMMEPPWK